jgi:predicted DsbA family dithiol-disulfide isomerase
VEWRAFELHPGVPPEGQVIPFSPERRAAGRRNFERLADEAGLEYGPRDHWYDSQPAHEATVWAGEHGRADELKRAVFRAYFVHDRNIGSPEVLAELAAGIGLDGADLRAALAAGRHRAAVQEQFEEARMVGVTAVPTFVAGGFALVGAHPIETLRKLLAHAGAQPLRRAAAADQRFESGENLLGPNLRELPSK